MEIMWLLWLFVLMAINQCSSGNHAVAGVPCPFNVNCTCYSEHGSNTSDCSHQGFQDVPHIADVYHIEYLDLSFNSLSQLASSNIFPSSLRYLDLSFNNFTLIEKGILDNLYNLETLNVSACYISTIEHGAFSRLYNLVNLNVSRNHALTFKAMSNITYGANKTKIKMADVSGLHCTGDHRGTVLYTEDIENLEGTNLTEIHISNNKLNYIQIEAVQFIPKTIRIIYARGNELFTGIWVMTLAKRLESLEYVDISKWMYKVTDDIPTICDNMRCRPSPPMEFETPRSIFNKIRGVQNDPANRSTSSHQRLAISNRGFSELPFLRNLKILKVNYHFVEITLPKLDVGDIMVHHLEAKHNLIHSLVGSIGRFPWLQFLDLSFNFCYTISVKFFSWMTNLTSLVLSNNFLGLQFVEPDSVGILSDLTKLTALNLSQNRIRFLQYNAFRGQNQLWQLDLSQNILKVLNLSLGHMHHLKHFNLSNNMISVISEETRKGIDNILRFNPTLEMNMKMNPIECSCDNLPGLLWFKSNREIFKDFDQYTCVFQNHTTIKFENIKHILTELEKDCRSYLAVILSCVGGVFISICLIATGMYRRYRWKIKYMYYGYKARNETPVQQNTERLYDYDIFVSYSEEQSMFATKDMVLKLETEHGLRLCLHQRDFTIGKSIGQNITSAIKCSRKTLIVLSKAFMESDWCIFEFNMARLEEIYAREGRFDLLFVVMYEQIPNSKLPLELFELIERQSYIEYPNDEQGNVMFWNKLFESVRP